MKASSTLFLLLILGKLIKNNLSFKFHNIEAFNNNLCRREKYY